MEEEELSPGKSQEPPRLKVDNRSGYVTSDLHHFFSKGLKALGVRQPTRVIVVPSPIRSRGCAQVGQGKREGSVIVIAIASPSRFDLRRLARLFEHEVTHKLGSDHGDMDENTLYSLGHVPSWARGTRLRYRGKAKSQL